MFRRTIVVALIVLALTPQLPAQQNATPADLTGEWSGSSLRSDGTREDRGPTFTFKQQGEKLTGAFVGSLGNAELIMVDPFAITDGQVKGTAVSFAVVFVIPVQGTERKMKFLFDGTVAGDEINLTRSSVLNTEYSATTTKDTQRFVLTRR